MHTIYFLNPKSSVVAQPDLFPTRQPRRQGFSRRDSHCLDEYIQYVTVTDICKMHYTACINQNSVRSSRDKVVSTCQTTQTSRFMATEHRYRLVVSYNLETKGILLSEQQSNNRSCNQTKWVQSRTCTIIIYVGIMQVFSKRGSFQHYYATQMFWF